MPIIFFPVYFVLFDLKKKKAQKKTNNRIALGILWNVYHSSFDKAKDIQVD